VEKRSWLAENRPKSSTPEVLYGLLLTFFEIDLDSSIGCHVPFREAKRHGKKTSPKIADQAQQQQKHQTTKTHGNFKSISYILEVKDLYESPFWFHHFFPFGSMYFLLILTDQENFAPRNVTSHRPQRLPAWNQPGSLNKCRLEKTTLQGINISYLGKRKIIFKMSFLGDMLVPWRVHYTHYFHGL